MKQVKRPQTSAKNIEGFITTDKQMISLLNRLEKIARTDASVLLRGDSGSGKELLANFIHKKSPRSAERFAAINCATLDSDLMSSELFGHVKGAFTGAVSDREGLLSIANRGTLFLDEIAEMPLEIQARLLRIIQEKKFSKLGTWKCINTDIRFISATHQSLRKLVEEGKFREDLMYRIRVVPFFIPNLSERKDDIPYLLWSFIDQLNNSNYRTINSIEDKAFEKIMDYSWPGNVRELRNNIEYALAVGEGDTLKLEDLNPDLIFPNPYLKEIDEDTSASEKEEILKLLRKFGGQKAKSRS